MSAYEDEFEKGALVDLEKLSIPRTDVVRSLLLVLVVFRWRWVVFVVRAPLYNLRSHRNNRNNKVT